MIETMNAIMEWNGHLLVVDKCISNDLLERVPHDSLHLQQPIFHITCRVKDLTEWYHLPLTRKHLSDGKVILKFELVHKRNAMKGERGRRG